MILLFLRKKISLMLKIHLSIGWFFVGLLVSSQALADLNIAEFYKCDAAFCPDAKGQGAVVSHTMVKQKLKFTTVEKSIKNALKKTTPQESVDIIQLPQITLSLPSSSLSRSNLLSRSLNPDPNQPENSPQSTTDPGVSLQGVSGLGGPQQRVNPSSTTRNGGSLWQGFQGTHSSSRSSRSRGSNFKPSFGTGIRARGSSARASKVGIGQGGVEIDSVGGPVKNNPLWNDLTEDERLKGRGGVVPLGSNPRERGQAAMRPRSSGSPLSSGMSRSMPSGSAKKGKAKAVTAKKGRSLGLRFFGSPGSRYRGSRRRSLVRNQKRQVIKKKSSKMMAQQARSSLKLPRDLLKRNFNKKFRRRTANNLELNGPNTSLFQKVCEHYDHFTKIHGIPDYQRRCQK